jgi:hypothetical protein
MALTQKEIERYYRIKAIIPKLVLKKLRGDVIIHGERAVQARLPYPLHRETVDYDLYSKTPRKSAKMLEKELEAELEADYFKVKKGRHEGTWKVKSKVDEENYADFTRPSSRTKLDYDVIEGKKYLKLKLIKEKIKQNLKAKTKAFRHSKERSALRRIGRGKKIERMMSLGFGKPLKKKNQFLRKSKWI